MLEELAALAKLAEVDSAASDIEKESEQIPTRLGEFQADLQRLEELLQAERQQLSEAEQLYKAQAEEMEGQNQALARSKAKSAKARNMREADAVERELESVRRSLRDREAEHEQLSNAIEQRRKLLAQHEKEFEDLKKLAEDEQGKGQARLEELQQDRDRVLAGRDEVVAKISRTVLKRYERIRERRGGVAVVPVVNETCSGCNVALPPQQVIRVQRGDVIEQCPQCSRILYVPGSLPDPEA